MKKIKEATRSKSKQNHRNNTLKTSANKIRNITGKTIVRLNEGNSDSDKLLKMIEKMQPGAVMQFVS